MTASQVEDLMLLIEMLNGYVEFDPGGRLDKEVALHIARLRVLRKELQEQGKL